MILEDTPIEKHSIKSKTFYVKREDLYSQYPAPSLSKLRGIKKLLEKLDPEKIKTIGVVDTRISKSGWGVTYLCLNTKFKVKCFYPQLKNDKGLPYPQFMTESLGGKIVPIPAGRINIVYSKAKKLMEKEKGYLLPMGLILKETMEEVSKVINLEYEKYKTIVVSLGTGTICAGIIKGCIENNLYPDFYGVSCGMSLERIKKRMESLLGNTLGENIKLIPPAYEYYDTEDMNCGFPSSKYYDKKAFIWMLKNYAKLKKPILFWNIGV